MGGMGSGRHWYYGAKDTTSNYQSIDVRRWHKDGLLNSIRAFNWQWTCNGDVIASIGVRPEPGRVNLVYRHKANGGEWQEMSYPIMLEWTSCNFGGERPWFLCPASGCGRRVAILYGGRIFACRHCYQLAYASQRETYDERAVRKADRIREKLGWEPGILNGSGWKPKGMHWKTFQRLNAQHDVFVQSSLAGMAARFGLIGESLDDWV